MLSLRSPSLQGSPSMDAQELLDRQLTDEQVKRVLDCLRHNICQHKDIAALPFENLEVVRSMLTLGLRERPENIADEIRQLDTEWDALTEKTLMQHSPADQEAYETLCAFYKDYLSDKKKFFNKYSLLVDELGYEVSHYRKSESDSTQEKLFELRKEFILNNEDLRENEPQKLDAIGKYLHAVRHQSETVYQDSLCTRTNAGRSTKCNR